MNTIEQSTANMFAPVEKMAQQLESFTRQQKARLLVSSFVLFLFLGLAK